VSVRAEQLGSHWTDFHDIRNLSIFKKSVDKIQLSSNTDKNNVSCMLSFGYFPGVRLSFADVSEPSVRSIFKSLIKNIFFIKPLKMDLAEGSETSAKLNLTPGKYPKENIQDSEHGENLESRIYIGVNVNCGY
jgi:hypothetical protein